MKRMGMSAKLYSTMGILAAVAIGVAWLGIAKLAEVKQQMDVVTASTAPMVQDAGNLNRALMMLVRAQKNVCLGETDEDKTKFVAAVDEPVQLIEQYRKALGDRAAQADNRQVQNQLAAFDATFAKYSKINQAICDLSLKNTNNKAWDLYDGALNDSQRKVADALDKMEKDLTGIAVPAAKSANDVDALAAAEDRLVAVTGLRGCLARLRYRLATYIAAEPDTKAKLEPQMEEVKKEAADRLKSLHALTPETDLAAVNALDAPFASFLDGTGEIIALGREDTNRQAYKLSIGEGNTYATECRNILQSLGEDLTRAMQRDREAVEATYYSARRAIVAVSVAGILLAAGIAVVTLTRVSRGIRRVVTALQTGAGEVASASEHVAQSSQQMAEGASEQASSLEETSASLEEMAGMTSQNAIRANEAQAMSEQACGAAAKGREAIVRMGQAIAEIKESSDRTAQILKNVDEIAFQTNLLALNAAVEAARAGEAGRGFAVVAEEVRNLAQRSARAAKDTEVLIEGAQRNAERGVNVSAEVNRCLDEIVSRVEKVARLVEEVALASTEQAEGIEQVNLAVGDMDQVTQEGAANSEEAASAAEELSAQAEQMHEIVLELQALVNGVDSAEERSPAPEPRAMASGQRGLLASIVRPAAGFPPLKLIGVRNGNGHAKGNGGPNGHAETYPDGSKLLRVRDVLGPSDKEWSEDF